MDRLALMWIILCSNLLAAEDREPWGRARILFTLIVHAESEQNRTQVRTMRVRNRRMKAKSPENRREAQRTIRRRMQKRSAVDLDLAANS